VTAAARHRAAGAAGRRRTSAGGTPKAATLTETFRSLNGARWPGNTSGVSVVGWRGRVTMPATVGPSEKWSTEPFRYDLTGSSYSAELALLPTSTAAAGLHAINNLSPENKVMIGVEGGNVLMRKVEAGVVSDTTVAFDRVLHRWLRLRHDGTNVLWETSTNGSVWTTRRTATTTVDLTSVFLTLEGTWQTTVGAGRLEWANVNTAPVTALAYTPPPFGFGTLRTIGDIYTDKADDEFTGGNRIGMYELFWDRAEGTNGTFSSSYASTVAAHTATIRGAGLKLTVGLGLHYPPSWTSAIPNYRFVNESAGFSTQLNYVFNQQVRTRAEQYLSWINQKVGFANCWAVRITAGGDPELLYPPSGLWGYDPNAQGTGTDLPLTVGPCPWPGWTPGTGTTTQAAEWYEWYMASLVDAANWQMRYIRSLGFTGWFEVLTPGSGVRPSGLATDIGNRLTGYAATTGVGAAWHKTYQHLVDRHGVVAYCSSMADNSGTVPNDVPDPADTAVAITSSSADGWSAYRWIKRLADEFTDGKNGGENPGRGALSDAFYLDTSSAGMMSKFLAQGVAGKALSMYWAHSEQLWGQSTLSFSGIWAPRVAAINTTGPGVPPNPP
jgi:hypothetical protein